MERRPYTVSEPARKRREAMLARYQEGYSIRQVADEFGVSFQAVHQILCKYGVERRPAHVNRRASNYTGKRP